MFASCTRAFSLSFVLSLAPDLVAQEAQPAVVQTHQEVVVHRLSPVHRHVGARATRYRVAAVRAQPASSKQGESAAPSRAANHRHLPTRR